MSNEREILASSLQPPLGSAAARYESRVPHKEPGCPPAADLVLLLENRLAPAAAGLLRRHLEACPVCQADLEGFERVLSKSEKVVLEVARLFNQGIGAAELLKQSDQPADAILAALCSARDKGLLGPSAAPRPERGAALPRGGPKSLLTLLRERSRSLRNVTVRQSRDPVHGESRGSWDERIRAFGNDVAPLLVSLLAGSSHVGVAWGRTVAAAIAGVGRACEAPPARQKPLVCVATVGGLVGELKVRAESSSSILASRLGEAINGDWEHLLTLHGLEAFISFVETAEEIDTIRKRIMRFPNYQAIFGGPGEPGAIGQLDAIVTSCGNAHHFNQFWTTELPQLGVSPERLNSLTHGNIGGVLLEREGLEGHDKDTFDDIARRWTGIRREHYEQLALRDPGVILLAIGSNKADVVLKCAELNLVSELIVDEDLALALWDRVDPHRLYPRTLEAVLCRQLHP
jgi:DNA-binding transcriptional regulator LsrR (DeoR family)